MRRFFAVFGSLTLQLGLMIACEAEEPTVTPLAGSDVAGGSSGGLEGGMNLGGAPSATCESHRDDYPGSSWPECISDEGRYELAGENTPSSAARTAAYEQIAARLWRSSSPSSEDFIQAELIYAEAEGLQSRVARRYDAHMPKPEGADCALNEAASLWPDYCVGPAQIDPLIGEAFLAGIMGEEPHVNAKRVQAGLLWFLYVSAYKEASSCVAKAKDCDSHWAYTNGAVQRDEPPLGFGGWAQRANAYTHERLFDAHLAVRCWRDLDNGAVAEDEQLMSQATGQLARALDFALAQGLLHELRSLERLQDAGDTRASAIKAGLSILGPVIGRALNERQPIEEGLIEWSAHWSTLSNERVTALIEQLTTHFSCP